MSKEIKSRVKVPPTEPKREHRMVCLMSEDEAAIVERYLKKYKITNRGRWMRETLLSFVYHTTVEEDYPTLFNEHEMRR